MMSKWEWIEKACKIRGYNKSAVVARQIELALKEKYGNTKTTPRRTLKEFQERNVFSNVTFYIIERFAASPEFCIGCEMTTSCGGIDCLFGRKYGYCDHGSLYGEFRRTLAWEYEKRDQISSEENK